MSTFFDKVVRVAEHVEPQDVAVVSTGLITSVSVHMDIINNLFALMVTTATFIYMSLRIKQLLKEEEKEKEDESTTK